jgi:hypothetical protein
MMAVSSSIVLRLGLAAIVLGLFGLLLSAGLPDVVLVAIGFAVAASAVGLGLWLRPDE